MDLRAFWRSIAMEPHLVAFSSARTMHFDISAHRLFTLCKALESIVKYIESITSRFSPKFMWTRTEPQELDLH